MGIEPIVSIVIPVYNGEDYIEGAINSILQQDYPMIELIVLDDGSKDRTPEILSQFGAKFHWESHPNIGQANTLNKGWQMSKGQILSYLSADDHLLPHAVSTSIKHLQDLEGVVLTYCNFNLIDPQSHIIRKVSPADFDYYDMVVNFVCHPGPGVFFRRNAFEIAGLWNSAYKQMPDYEYWTRLGLTGKFYHIPEVLASFRVHDQSQTFAKGDPAKSDEPIIITTEYFKRNDIPDHIRSAEHKARSNAHLTSAQLHWRADRLRTALNYCFRAFSIYPMNLFTFRFTRLLLNAIFNRVFHKILWTVKDFIFKNPAPNIKN